MRLLFKSIGLFFVKKSNQLALRAALFLIVGGFSVLPIFHTSVRAQIQRIEWDQPFNLSLTEETSRSPFLLSDKSGRVHIFWAEDMRGEQVVSRSDTGEVSVFLRPTNTIMYSTWDGTMWTQPVDILLTPGFESAGLPKAVIDDEGYIHVIWTGYDFSSTNLYYSSARAVAAGSAKAWSSPVIIASGLSGTQSGTDIAYESPSTLHVLYARVEQGEQPSEPRATSYISSTDDGMTWSRPVDLYRTLDPQRGASATRLFVSPTGPIFASWSEWNEDGNGQAIFVSYSQDSGLTWSLPIKLAERDPTEYEHDWVNIAWLGGERFVATWEGGLRAYPQASYSEDNGVTWGPPIERYSDLIGENGFTEFAYDGDGTLHAFIAQRGRSNFRKFGLWHSTWLGDRWSQPDLLGGINAMYDSKAVIVSGNRFVAAWYTDSNRLEFSPGDIMVMTGEFVGVSAVPPQAFPTPIPTPSIFGALSTSESAVVSSITTPEIEYTFPMDEPEQPMTGLGLSIFSSAFLTLLALGMIVLVQSRAKRS